MLAAWFDPAALATMSTEHSPLEESPPAQVSIVGRFVVMLNVPILAPSGRVILGTVGRATSALLLFTLTAKPPLGAWHACPLVKLNVRVTVPIALSPPRTVAGWM